MSASLPGADALTRRAALLLPLALLLSGCALFGRAPVVHVAGPDRITYELECDSVDHGPCAAQAHQLIRESRARHPSARIISVTVGADDSEVCWTSPTAGGCDGRYTILANDSPAP